MRKFDYSFLKRTSIPTHLIDSAFRMGVLRSSMEDYRKLSPNVFDHLESVARMQSVKASNEIEGITITDERMRAIVNQNSEPLNHNEIEISGYRDAFDTICETYNDIYFNEANIKDLHYTILPRTVHDYGGKYKDVDNYIVEIDAYGNKRLRFKPISAEETPKAMEQLILAYRDASETFGISRLLLIPCVILDFLCIHPFIDGNGRLSRLLSLLLLYQSGHDVIRYISFEGQINKYRSYYYSALKASSTNWDTGENDYMPFIEQFIFTLYKCYEELDRRFDSVSNKCKAKKTLVEAEILGSLSPLSRSDLQDLLPEVSLSTINSAIRNLLSEGRVRKIEDLKTTKYVRV